MTCFRKGHNDKQNATLALSVCNDKLIKNYTHKSTLFNQKAIINLSLTSFIKARFYKISLCPLASGSLKTPICASCSMIFAARL